VTNGIITFTTFDGSVGTFSNAPLTSARHLAGMQGLLQRADDGVVAAFTVGTASDNVTELTLTSGDFGGCTAPRRLAAKKPPTKVVRQLWGSAKGHFRTTAKYSSATIRGTVWLTQDRCDGHPAPGGTYHYHDVSSCILAAAKGPSNLVGWAFDGYPIVVERYSSGDLPSDADLDSCHGRTSPVLIGGSVVTTYHYDATLEYPYTLGCFHGTKSA